jgi:hypothetical protein
MLPEYILVQENGERSSQVFQQEEREDELKNI